MLKCCHSAYKLFEYKIEVVCDYLGINYKKYSKVNKNNPNFTY